MQYETVRMNLADLREDADNPRIHDRRNIDVIKQSLQEFKQYRTYVVQKGTNRIIIGNGMYRAMLELGWTHADVRLVALTDEQARLLSIFDNRASDTSEFKASIAEMLDMLPEDLRELAGFTAQEIENIKTQFQEEAGIYVRSITADTADSVKFVLGRFSFTVSRPAYETWLSGIELSVLETEILQRLGVPAQ